MSAIKNNHSGNSESHKYEFEAEYKALIHARTKRTIEKFNVELSSFNS